MNRLRLGHHDRCFLPLLQICSFLVILSALLLFGPAPRALADATITVEANQIKGYINPLVFGQNVMANSNTMWDHRTDSLRKELDDSGIKVKAKIEGLAPTILRFPGGTVADLYFWEDGLSLLTTNQLNVGSHEISLDDKPKTWGITNKGLLLHTKTLNWEAVQGQLGDAFTYTGIDLNNQELTGVGNLNPNNPPDHLYPAGLGVRPGGRKWNGYQVIDGTGEYDNTYGIVEHMKVVNSLGAEALITVNYMTKLNSDGTVSQGTSLPANDQRLKRAQALVVFCNGRTNDTRLLGFDNGNIDWHTVGYWARKRAALGFPQPFDVRFWQVGNEPYYDIYIRTNYPTIPAVYEKAFEAPLATTYGADFTVFAQKMKEIDPKIKVGAAGMRPDQKSRSGGRWLEYYEDWNVWNDAVLNRTKNDLDFFSIHPYYPDYTEQNASYDDHWLKAIMAGATQALDDLKDIQGTIDGKVPAPRKNNIGLPLTEYGFWRSGGTNEEWSILARGLLDADFLMSLIKETLDPVNSPRLRLSVATVWNLHGCNPTAAIGYQWPDYVSPGSRVIRPQYYAMQMVKNALATKRLVHTTINNNPLFELYLGLDVGNVKIDSAECLQAVAAVPNTNEDSLVLVVLNRSIDNTISAYLNHSGYGSPSVTTLGYGKSPGDHNESENNHYNVTTQPGSYQARYPFPPNSLTVFEFTKTQ